VDKWSQQVLRMQQIQQSKRGSTVKKSPKKTIKKKLRGK
jgi:hypothetical protein